MSEPCLCGDPYCGRCFPTSEDRHDQDHPEHDVEGCTYCEDDAADECRCFGSGCEVCLASGELND